MMTDISFQPVMASAPCTAQIGAICWRLHRGRVEVLLITSRDTGRWVIPKGWPITGLSAAAAAAREAWEEAGVEGHVHEALIGAFRYDKMMAPDPAIPCSVTVFALRVASLNPRFPERKLRRRKWFDVQKAAKQVAEPGLRELLRELPANPNFQPGATLASD